MSTKEKMTEMLFDLQESLKADDLEEALTVLSMMKNAEQLDKWLSE